MTVVRVATEGDLDYAVARRLLGDVGLEWDRVAPARGRESLLNKLAGYNRAAAHEHWLVLIDLDRDQCAPTLLREWIPAPADGMVVRVAVREIESWLLADRGIARRLRVPASALPRLPDDIEAPKRFLVDLVRAQCKTKMVRNRILPGPRSTSVGPRYSGFLSEFVESEWEPRRAAERSPSLGRAIGALERLANA